VGLVGLGQSADGLGWIGSHKIDPWTTLDLFFLNSAMKSTLSYGLLDANPRSTESNHWSVCGTHAATHQGHHQIGVSGCEVCYLQVRTVRCRYTAVVRAAGRSSGSAQSQHARMSLGLTPRRRCLHPGSLHQVVTPPPIRQPSIVMATSVCLSVCVLLCFIVIIRP